MLRNVCRTLLMACLLLGAATATVSAAEVLGARYPTLSPDGTTVAFEYWGDIWCAPVDASAPARRLTDHRAWDYLPRYSPDGAWLAFVSRRSGNDDLWVMPAQGGAARQLTTYSGTDKLSGWSPDGQRLLYTADRDYWAADLYSIALGGDEPPVAITSGDHYTVDSAVQLPDGGYIYARGGGRWWRKNYRGTSQWDIWRLTEEYDYERLTDHPGFDLWPMAGPAGRNIYYVSDVDGVPNIWGRALAMGETHQLTFHDADGVQWPSLTPGGETIAYEWNGGIYLCPIGGEARQLEIDVAAEPKDNLWDRDDFRNDAESYAVSPHGKYVVVVHAGDLWAVKDPEAYDDDEEPDQDLTEGWRLTASDDARERCPAFAPDNRRLAYASDADGDYEIYVMDLSDMSVRQVTDNAVDDLDPQFDPSNADVLYYYSGNRELQRRDLTEDDARTIAEGRFRQAFDYLDFAVSPDGRWVAYTDELWDWSGEVFIVDSLGENAPVNITRHPGGESRPRWSADGRRLVYASDRDDGVIYVVDLDPEPERYDLEFLFEDDRPDGDEEEPDEDEDAVDDDEENGDENGDNGDDEEEDEEDEDDNGDNGKKKDDKDEEVEVTIDFTDIHLRARHVSLQRRATRPILSNDGEWVIYECRPNDRDTEIWAVKAEGGDERRVTGGGWRDPQFAAKGKRLYHRDGGRVRYFKYADGKSRGTENVELHGEYTYDQRARWRQMFAEGWRTLGQRFYDPQLHGTDWPAVYDKYAPYIEQIVAPEEFGLVFEELMGELNGSHLAIYVNGSSLDVDGPATGHLGLEFDEDYDGAGLRISHVTYQGPADQPGVELEAGDVVLSVEGAPVGRDRRWEPVLDDRADKPVRLTVADGDGEREVVLKAASYGRYKRLLYREWELDNEHFVDERSGGRIGYIHISGMSRSELRKFEREFVSEFFDRDALIVDVRFNPGGWIHEDLYQLLDRGIFAYAQTRDAERVIQPARAFNKPKALLINARSGSDAEIFPAGWRALGLGPIIGIDTAGAVIGTTGFTLIDGTWVRLPIEGWFELDGRNLELSGTPPDIYIDVDPAELRDGYDAQLAKAVDVLLAELEKE